MTVEVIEQCPECRGEGAIIHPHLEGVYQGSHADTPPDPVRVSCEHCGGTGEITSDDHDAFKFKRGTVVDYRGTKRVVFYEHEGDHVILWWFPGDVATHGPPDATEAEKNVIYGQLWQELEDHWAPSSDDDRDC